MNKNNQCVSSLNEILANTYAIYLKTQNFHWNIEGPHFYALHKLFEEQYEELAEAVDTIAERIRSLGHKAPASFNAYQQLSNIQEGNIHAKTQEMLQTLANDHLSLCEQLKKAHALADEVSDIGTASLIEDRIRAHDKAHWMLISSL